MSSTQQDNSSDPAQKAASLHEQGLVYARQRKFSQAIEFFRMAIEHDPTRVLAIRHIAQAYQDLGSLTDAEVAWKEFATHSPDSADGYHQLGNLQRRMGKPELAAQTLRAAVERNASSPWCYLDLGLALAEAKQYDDAAKELRRAIELDQSCYDAHLNLGMVLQETGHGEAALTQLRQATELKPAEPSAWNNLGIALAEQGKYEEAIAAYEKLLAEHPDYVLAWNNLGNALRTTGQNQRAIECMQKAIALRPDYTEAFNNIGIIYTQTEQFDEAIEAFNKALFLRPDYPEAHANRGLVYLLRGDFQRGWADYEWRFRGKSGLQRRTLPGKYWDGSPLTGKRILLYYEQGLGDTFQFIRYAKELKGRGATVVFECQPILRNILDRTPGIDEFTIRGERPPAVDFNAALLSLPGLCQSHLDTLPRRVPYIFADPELVWDWKQQLAALRTFKVGIVWQGNPQHKGDRRRSIPLAAFKPLAAVEGVSLISLQKNFGVEQIKTLGDDFNLIDLDGIAEEADGFQRTASIIANLDLVIAADTSVAHLAGAMGVPVWLALPMSPDWRWLLGRQDTPWYPTMRLFRQQSDGDWNELMSRMAVGLADRVTSLFAGKSSTGPVPSIADLSKLVRTAKEHLQAGRFSEAEGTFRSALAADPLNFELYQDLGVALAKQNRMPEALDHFRRGLELSPESAGLYGNIGVAYQHLGRHEEAVAHFRKSIWLGSGSANTHKNLANALMALPDPAAAEESLLAALRLEPDDAEAHYMLSQALLMQGKYDAGWLEQEWRWKWKSNAKRIPQCPRWAGQALTGKRLLIVCEEDPRDTIQLMRYADLVHHLGGRVVVECTEELAELLKGCAGVEQVVLAGGDGPGCDLYSYIKSMPLAYSSVFGSVPAPRPYLGVLPQHVTLWNQRLGNESLKVAVVVGRQNRMFHIYDVLRSLNDGPPLQILAISQEPDASSYVVERAGDRHHTSSRYSATLAEVAGALRSAELVISEDDLLGHVAAAMGVATWITLPVVAHPRWLTHRDDSPWYPSVRLFRHVRVQEFPAYAGHVAESAHKWLNNSPRREQTAD